MRTVGIVLLALALLIAGLFMFTREPSAESNATIRSFSSVQTDISNGAALLDVRTSEEFAVSHFEGADNHPLQLLQAGTMPTLDTAITLYLYCQSGNRSAQAAAILQEAGYTVVDLGGLRDVEAIGGTLQEG